MKKKTLLLYFILLPFLTFAQPPAKITTSEYIHLYKGDAVKDMMKMGVPASITLAQGILESESGNSVLAREARNHFGIKCHKDWNGETFHKDDDAKDECFRKYKSVLESYDDHGRFLRDRPRYAFLFEYEITDYKSWAHGLKKAGYATNPRYADLLIKLIEDHKLNLFDFGGKTLPVTLNTASPVAAKDPTLPSHNHNNSVKPVAGVKPGINSNSQQVPYLIAGKNDSWFSVATAQDLRLWQILKYNDASQNDGMKPGSIIYLKPKRGRPSMEFHVYQQGETLWEISQMHGVKLKKLNHLNNFESVVSLKTGQKIKLR